MINLKIKGGLGNQLFQYAASRNLAFKNNTSLNIDYSSYSHSGNDTPRQYLLDLFNTKIDANLKSNFFYDSLSLLDKIFNKLGWKLRVYFNKYYFEKGAGFDDDVLSLKDNSWLSGYFQSEKYFKEISDLVKKELNFKDPEVLTQLPAYQEIENTNSVFIHVRRGDYVSNPRYSNFYHSCSVDYYKQAISLIKEKVREPQFFIFSDDPEWVRENLPIENAVFISDLKLKDYEDLFLMSKCKYAIIANSSFSWWGGWMINNKDKIVIAPKKWFKDDKMDSDDIICEGWITL